MHVSIILKKTRFVREIEKNDWSCLYGGGRRLIQLRGNKLSGGQRTPMIRWRVDRIRTLSATARSSTTQPAFVPALVV